MKNYDFPHDANNLPQQCGIGWLIEDKIKDQAVKGMTQNMLDFYSMKYRKIPQVSGHSVEDLCQAGLDNGFAKIVIFKQGVYLRDFIEKSKNLWDTKYKDCVIVGHILDRQDSWWQIHPQTLYIDLEWWKDADKPNFGIRDDEAPWTALQISRSVQTFSNPNDYNPVEVVATDTPQECKGKSWGWELLYAAVQNGKKIGVWDQDLRNSKEYVYGEMDDYYEKVWNIGQQIWQVQWYASNTENLETEVKDKNTGTVFSTCGGLSPICNAYVENLQPGCNLNFMDVDVIALHMQEQLWSTWDGKNYKKWVEDYMELNPMLASVFACSWNLDMSQEYINDLGVDFHKWWNSTAKSFKLKFHRVDIMNKNRVLQLIGHERTENPGKDIFVDFSNAINFEVNSTVYSKDIRKQIESDYLEYEKNHPDVTLKGLHLNDMDQHHKQPWLHKIFPWNKI